MTEIMDPWELLAEQKQRYGRRVENHRKLLKRERRLRREAEANAKRFHALLIQERVRRIPTR